MLTASSSRRRFSWRTIRAIMRREFIDVVRDRRSLILTFLYPISMLIMYGYGIRYDVDNVPLTILDYDETPESRDLVQQMIRSGSFQLVRWARDQHDVDRDLTTDASKAAVIIPSTSPPASTPASRPRCRRSSTARTRTPPPSPKAICWR